MSSYMSNLKSTDRTSSKAVKPRKDKAPSVPDKKITILPGASGPAPTGMTVERFLRGNKIPTRKGR